jgi:hypothetical protein
MIDAIMTSGPPAYLLIDLQLSKALERVSLNI